MNVIPVHQLLDVISRSPMLSAQPDRAEVRELSLVVTAMLFYSLAEPGTYILFVTESLTHKTAYLSQTIGGLFIGCLFWAAAILLLPHLYLLSRYPDRLAVRWPRRLATAAGLCGAVLWLMLAVLSRPLDAEWVTTVFSVRCLVDFVLGALYAVSLNRQLLRETAARLSRDHDQDRRT